MTADLFGEALVPGLDYRPDFIVAAEERELVEQIECVDLSPFRFRGWIGKRKTHSFGWRYDFDDASFAPSEPIPDWLKPLRAKVAALAGIEPAAFVHALVTRYEPGSGIGWHRDRTVFDKVVGVSLGAPSVLRFRQRTDTGFRRVALPVEPRSAYLLTGDARHEWEHSIAPGAELRLSITLRTLSDLGRSKAAGP